MENDGLFGVSINKVLSEFSSSYFKSAVTTMDRTKQESVTGRTAFQKWLTYRQEMVSNGWNESRIPLNFEGYMQWQASWQQVATHTTNRSRWWDGRRPPPPIEIRPVHERKGRARGIRAEQS